MGTPKYQIKTQPASEPITLSEAKSHLRVDLTTDDTYITTLITVARKYCENYCNRYFITQTFEQWYDSFLNMKLSANPVQSVTHIKYYDEDDVLQTLASSFYVLDNVSDVLPSEILEAPDKDFPTYSIDVANPILVEYVVGYGSASDVPDDIKHAILFMISYLYENREGLNVSNTGTASVVDINPPKVVRILLDNYRLYYGS